MGRKMPTGENPLIHPAISLSLVAACIAATIAMITALCGARFRRKSSRPPSASPHKTTEKSEIETLPPNKVAKTPMVTPSPPQTATTVEYLEDKTEKQIPQIQETLNPPPTRHFRGSSSYSYHGLLNSTSNLKLVTSLSMKIPRRKSVAKQQEKQNMKSEDSIWMKTIILGEKCRVPNEDDTILYDGKGNRITTFHPKTPRSLPVSRTTSFIDPEALPK